MFKGGNRELRALLSPDRLRNAIDETSEEEEDEVECAPACSENRIHIPMTTVRELLGESVELPMKVMVDVPGEGMRHRTLGKLHSTSTSLFCPRSRASMVVIASGA